LEEADDFPEVFAPRAVVFLIESWANSPFCHEKEASPDSPEGRWARYAFCKEG